MFLMKMASLLKVPLILSSAIAMHVALTPLHSASSDDNVVLDTFNEFIITLHVKYGLTMAKVPLH